MIRALAVITLPILLALVMPTPSGSPVADETICTPTQPNGHDAPGMDSPGWWYGENGLYISLSLSPDGTYRTTHRPDRPGATNWDKQFFVSDPPEPMTVSLAFLGIRLTSANPTVTSFPSSHEGTPFLNSVIWFPEPGCWQITLETPTRSLQVTVRVDFPDQPAPTP